MHENEINIFQIWHEVGISAFKIWMYSCFKREKFILEGDNYFDNTHTCNRKLFVSKCRNLSAFILHTTVINN